MSAPTFTRYCSHGSTDAWVRCTADKYGADADIVGTMWKKHAPTETCREAQYQAVLGFIRELKSAGYSQVSQLCKSCAPA